MVSIKQGYPEKVVGNIDNSLSGYFFHIEEGCDMLHESTIEKIHNIINKLKSEDRRQ